MGNVEQPGKPIAKAIFEAAQRKVSVPAGEAAGIVNAVATLDALAVVAASMLVSAPESASNKGMREVSEKFCPHVLRRMKRFREAYETDGVQPWDEVMTSFN